jgi:hypothetical protein
MHISRLETAAPAPRLKLVKDGKSAIISPDHPDIMVASRLLAEALGTTDDDFVQGTLHQLTSLVCEDKTLMKAT